jgi:Ni,Fe-hydrogenase I large subunit
MTTAFATPETKLNRALELVGSIDPEIEESYSSLEERILAQALENVELAERRLREVQELMENLSTALV